METTVQQKTDFIAAKGRLDEKNAKLLAEAETLLAKGDMMMEEEVVDVRERLGKLSEIINLSSVARNCFGKSRTWLYQRINGNKVNGKLFFRTILAYQPTVLLDPIMRFQHFERERRPRKGASHQSNG